MRLIFLLAMLFVISAHDAVAEIAGRASLPAKPALGQLDGAHRTPAQIRADHHPAMDQAA